MKRQLCYGLIAVLLGCAGCFTGTHELTKPPATSTAMAQPPPPVKVEQLTDSNGHQIADALAAEIDWDVQQSQLSKSPP
jgi:hypothetical protein